MRKSALALARAALLWERAAPVLIGPLFALALYSGLALFGVFELIGDPWRAIVALVLFLAAAGTAALGLRRFRAPTSRDVERRVEEDSGLATRPFEALRDRPAHGDDAMWQAHRARAERQLKTAKARRPRASWAAADPHGGRIAALLVLIVGVMAAGETALPRLGEAFSPHVLTGGGARATAEFWIEPPEYTGRATQFLRDRRQARAPEGSILAVRVSGSEREPRVSGMDAEIERIGPGVSQVRGRLDEDGEITIRLGALRETVRVAVIPDTPPRLSLVSSPEGDAEGRLILEFTAEDDYGVQSYALHLAREPDDGDPEDAEWEAVEVPASQIASGDGEGVLRARIETARHRFAGQRVLVRMAGTDGAGQTGVSAPIALTLPSRVFFDPLARAVAAERRGFIGVADAYADMPQLAQNEDHPVGTIILGEQPERRIERAPEPVRRLALALDAISDAPTEFFPDPVVYMGLRTAMNEVRRARELEELAHMDDDLWQIALRAELGTLADAEAALRAAEQALQDAFARGADEIELSALFDAFERAMRNYMQALVREAVEEQRQMAEGGGGGGRDMSADMLQELLDALREATELGDTEGARQALAQLLELLRNMQIQFAQGQGGEGGESEMAQALREAMEELSDMIGEQRGIMDETFGRARGAQRQAEADQDGGETGEGEAQIGQDEDPQGGVQEGDEGEGAFSEGDALSRRQGALRERLDALRENGAGATEGEAGEAFEDAGRFMEEAERALGDGDNETALAAQDDALASMREGADAMGQRLEEERRAGESGDQGETDPFGRPSGQGGGAGSVDVPTESERQRARDILEELRRRLGEPDRDADERGYIDRLLDRFGRD